MKGQGITLCLIDTPVSQKIIKETAERLERSERDVRILRHSRFCVNTRIERRREMYSNRFRNLENCTEPFYNKNFNYPRMPYCKKELCDIYHHDDSICMQRVTCASCSTFLLPERKLCLTCMNMIREQLTAYPEKELTDGLKFLKRVFLEADKIKRQCWFCEELHDGYGLYYCCACLGKSDNMINVCYDCVEELTEESDIPIPLPVNAVEAGVKSLICKEKCMYRPEVYRP